MRLFLSLLFIVARADAADDPPTLATYGQRKPSSQAVSASAGQAGLRRGGEAEEPSSTLIRKAA